MSFLQVTAIVDGSFYVEAPGAALRLLCGCPENIVKHLIRSGHIRQVEKRGLTYETGPNAILLSETRVEAGCFRNLAEFPVLQMLYKQGMIIPGHPNNDGSRPLIIGLREHIDAVAAYVYEGNYGLPRVEDIAGGGIGQEEAAEILREKRAFAFGHFKATSELLELRPIESPTIELKNGVFLRREGNNRYEIIFEGETVSIDLSASVPTPPPYVLPFSPLPRTNFGVVHIGEGDGWDPERPCMGSLVIAGDELWLIDAGPNIEESLAALGITASDLTGILHSHVHDDHFVGLTALMRGERKLRYCALPCVRNSTTRKLANLAGIDEQDFLRYFNVRDLQAREWSRVGNIEVYAVPAPHPVENSIFRLRSGGDGKVYAHLADLTSFDVMEKLIAMKDPEARMAPVSAVRAKAVYLETAELKKIDSGGGMIHGDAVDFAEDGSATILLSHCHATSPGKTLPKKMRVASFGDFSDLGGDSQLGVETRACRELARRFPSVPLADIAVLVRESGGAQAREMSPREKLLIAAGHRVEHAHVVLSGAVERIGRGGAGRSLLTAGAVAGEVALARNGIAIYDFRPRPGAELFAIPAALWTAFVQRWAAEEFSPPRLALRSRLEHTAYFEGLAQSAIASQAAKEAQCFEIRAGDFFTDPEAGVLLLLEGSAEILSGDRVLERIGPGGIYGEERQLTGGCCLFSARTTSRAIAAKLPPNLIAEHPILLWRAKEVFERRLSAARVVLDFKWKPSYEVGVEEIDRQHRGIFLAMERMLDVIAAEGEGYAEAFESIYTIACEHFKDEELLLDRAGYPALEEHRRAHAVLKSELEELAQHGAGNSITADFMKDCFLRHTLVMDRRYVAFLRKEGVSRT